MKQVVGYQLRQHPALKEARRLVGEGVLVSFGALPLGRLRPHQKALEPLCQGPPT